MPPALRCPCNSGIESRPAPSKETMEPILRSTGNAHARRIDEALGVIVDAAAPPAAMRMNIELSGFRCRGIGLRPRWHWKLVVDRPRVVRQHLLDIVDLVVIHDSTHEIGLPSDEISGEFTRQRRYGPPGHMFTVEHPLGVQELTIEGRNRQFRR